MRANRGRGVGRRAWLTTVLLACALGSCEASLATIEIERVEETVIARGTLLEALLGDLGFEDFAGMDVTAAQELENEGVEPGDIRDVRLTLFSLEVVEPPGGDLSFCDSVEVFVEAPGLERRRIARAASFPEGQATVELELDDVDLTAYAVSTSMTLSAEVQGRRPEADTRVRGRIELGVGVTLQGGCKAVRG